MRDMISEKMLEYRLLAKRAEYRRKRDSLISLLSSLDPAASYVSFSAGKDSSVIAHAAHAIFPSIPICMVDPGVPFHWTEGDRTTWSAFAAQAGWRLLQFPWDKWGAPGVAGAGSEKAHQRAAHASMFDDLQAWASAEGRPVVVMGLRAAESKARTMDFAARGHIHRYASGERSRVLPIATWTTDDVWTYIIEAGLPWLDIYAALGPDARNGMIGRSGIMHGRMAYLRRHFPEAWRVARDTLGLDYARNCS
jgi:3'-phosphoadenosine 5'-phosphosulfate sulfotransferase (PAPS reductase)/FAD synthetase